MTYDDAQHEAMETAYQWRRPTWIVFDLLERGLRVFCNPHPDYLKGESERYLPMLVVYPDGRRERAW